jgi:uncharacterized membrane protein
MSIGDGRETIFKGQVGAKKFDFFQKSNFWVVLILLLGTALRLLWPGEKSLWLDEAFSLWVANRPWGDLWGRLVTLDQHPPLYYAMLRVWTGWAGQSEVGLRSLSTLAGVITLPVLYATTRRLLTGPAAAITLLLLALSPFHIAYAQEARMYAWLGLAGAGAMWALAELWRSGWPTLRRAWGWWTLLILAEAGALWLHNSALLLPVAVTLAALALGVRPQTWVASQGIVGLLWLPWLPGFLAQVRSVADGFWIALPTAQTVAETFANFGVAFLPYWLPGRLLWAMPVVALAVWGAVTLLRRIESRRVGLALLALIFTPILIQLAASLIRPIYGDRTMIWAGLPFLILAAQGWVSLRQRRVRFAAAGMVLVLTSLALLNYYVDSPKEAWRDAATLVAAHIQPEESMIFNAGWTRIPFDYYFDQTPQGASTPRFGLPVDPFERDELEPVMAESDLPRLDGLIRDRPGVWLIYSHEAYTDPEGLILDSLEGKMTLAGEWSFVGVRVMRFTQ